MAIMAMAMARKTKFHFSICLLPLYFISSITSFSYAGEFTIKPNVGLTETYSDNVELDINNKTSSLVSQAIAGLNIEYKSPTAEFSFSGTESYVFYSHDSEKNGDYSELEANGRFYFWQKGPALVGSASTKNISRNNANNSLADLVSGDTVESRKYTGGLEYNIANPHYAIDSSVIYEETNTDDDIGNYSGYIALFNTQSNSAARNVFWQIKSGYSDRQQSASSGTNDGQRFVVDAIVGAITPYKINPFMRYYAEEINGSASGQNSISTPSIGPGISWLVSSHFMMNLSYNFTEDETVTDDYIAANINWQPSARTSLKAGYNQRFFGDSYNLDFQHRTKRLTNTISYKDTVQAFDRSFYQNQELGVYWCPTDGFSGVVSDCYATSGQPANINDYQLTSFSGFELIENNEFTLNKSFSWDSTLKLSRTTFNIKVATNERVGIESNIADDNEDASFSIIRKTAAKNDLTLTASYRHSIFDKDNPEGSRQEDYYRRVSVTYTKHLASSLSSYFTVQYLNRDSSRDDLSYNEVRAIINIKKEF